jgi:multidrug efflux system outer membrane protein
MKRKGPPQKKNRSMKNNSTIYSIIMCVFLFLSGCMAGPKYETPEVEVPEEYRFEKFDTADEAYVKWWSLFKNDRLQYLIKSALMENKSIHVAAARIEESRAYYRYTKADIWPKLDYKGRMFLSNINASETTVDEVNSRYLLAALLNWEIDFWGKYRRATESARAQLLGSEYGMTAVVISLVAEVAKAYFQLLDYKLRLQISIDTVKSRQESLRIIKERFHKGIVSEWDLNQAEIQEAIAAAAIPLYERLIVRTENILSILMGRNPEEIKADAKLWKQKLPDIPEGLPSELLKRRPDVAQAEQELAAQNAKIGVKQSILYPSISLTGSGGVVSIDLLDAGEGNVFWRAGGKIEGPIYHFGRKKRQVDIEEHRTEQVLRNYELIILEAFADVENALIEIDTYKREHEARRRQMESAENATKLSKARYDGGVASYLEVLESERSLFDAQQAAAETKQLELNSYVALYKALGGGWVREYKNE